MIGFDFSGLAIRVDGLPGHQEDRLAATWRAFVAPASAAAWLDVSVKTTPAKGRLRGEDAKEMRFVPGTGGAAHWTMAGGVANVPETGVVELSVDDGEGDDTVFAVVNLLHAAIACRLPALGGGLLHAAGALFDGRAFVLVGREGAGKSTWARAAGTAGAAVLSDDIVLVAPGSSGFEAVGSPLRAREFGGGVRGRWPLAGLLLPRHGPRVAIDPAGALLVEAALTANLPFVGDPPASRIARDAVVSRLAATVPARTLTFTREDSGIVALAGALP